MRRLLAWCWAAMATGAVRRPCSQEEIQELAGQITATRPLPSLFLILPGDEEHGPARLAQGVLVRVRAGGFLGSIAQRGSRNFSWQSTGGRAFLPGRRSLGRGRCLYKEPPSSGGYGSRAKAPWLHMVGRLRDPPAAACSERPRLGFRPRPPST